jgi:subtilisin family serine protease
MLPRELKVAVIDSGVNPRHPHISSVAGGASFTESSTLEGDFLDTLGHGTAVMAAIQEKAPDAAYYAAKVFHSSLATSAATLVRAIDWCIGQNMDVINLSLGTINPAHRELFTQAAARALEAGCLLVAAREAQGQLCYPGCLDTVFSVGMDAECGRDTFTSRVVHGSRVFYASGYPRSVPGVPPERNLKGISFAVANMTSLIVRALRAVPYARSRERKSQVAAILLASGR